MCYDDKVQFSSGKHVGNKYVNSFSNHVNKMSSERSAVTTRSQQICVTLYDTNYNELEKWDGDFSSRQLPRGTGVIGRILNITKREKGKSQVTVLNACLEVANELQDFWIFVANVYPKYIMSIRDQIQKDYKEFNRLKNYDVSRRSEKWKSDVQSFNKRMSLHSYDIKTTDENYKCQKILMRTSSG